MNNLLLIDPLVAYVFLGLFSLAVGSLLNVVIHRLPLMLQKEWRVECRLLLDLPEAPEKSVNLFFPRSFCPQCLKLIYAWQNIPILSFIFLRGRCHHCKHPIFWRYPLVEVLCMGLSLIAAWFFGFNATLVFACLFIWLLIPLCFIDLQHQILPDSLNLSLLWLGLIANTQSLFTTLPNAVLSAAGAYTGLWLFIKLFYLLTGKIGMGHGDFKLFAAFGAWFGWTQLPLILITASLSGAIVGIIYLKTTAKPHQTPIPFGPFLCIAGLLALFYGNAFWEWYLAFIIGHP